VPVAPLWLQRPAFPAHPQSGAPGVPEHRSPLPPPPSVVQSFEHDPHCVAPVETSASQPSSGDGNTGSLQFPEPIAHVELHVPAAHERDSTFADEHARPHAPQLSGSEETSCSQPSSGDGEDGLEQLSKPFPQVGVHTPLAHVRVTTFELEHGRLHEPQ
jgi:hypothetical protein